VRLADAIKAAFPGPVADGTLVLASARGRTGSFEVVVKQDQALAGGGDAATEKLQLHSKLSGMGHVNDAHVPKIMEGIRRALQAQ
jgi:hypothetical protein